MIIYAQDHHLIVSEFFTPETGLLDEVYRHIENGTLDQFTPAAYYARRELLTADVVDAVCMGIDAYFLEDATRSALYHRNQQECPDGVDLIPTGFADMPLLQRRALVERIDEIMQPYRKEPSPQPETPSPDDAHGVGIWD